MEKLAVTCKKAAIMLAVPVEHVYKLIKSGKLRATGKGRGVRVLVATIEAHKAAPIAPHIPKPLVFKTNDKAKGFVYLVRLGLYHKIGITKNVRNRLSGMQVGHPDEIELVHTIPTNDMFQSEALLHGWFAAQRVRGEWFGLQPDQVAAICEYKSLMF